ncbi:MAG: hypothetical protein R2769_14185 [Saprospiraceae bacterium]
MNSWKVNWVKGKILLKPPVNFKRSVAGIHPGCKFQLIKAVSSVGGVVDPSKRNFSQTHQDKLVGFWLITASNEIIISNKTVKTIEHLGLKALSNVVCSKLTPAVIVCLLILVSRCVGNVEDIDNKLPTS